MELVRAVGLTDAKMDIHVLFLGHHGNEELSQVLASLPHPQRIHFAGYRINGPEIMAASDVCCLPVLRGEGLSRAIIEGMAYAVVPLVTDVGGNAELVVNGECGLVVPAGDVAALARALEWLYEHPEERRRMGQAARADRSHFNSADTVRKTLACTANWSRNEPFQSSRGRGQDGSNLLTFNRQEVPWAMPAGVAQFHEPASTAGRPYGAPGKPDRIPAATGRALVPGHHADRLRRAAF
jgi:hypothetical protein